MIHLAYEECATIGSPENQHPTAVRPPKYSYHTLPYRWSEGGLAPTAVTLSTSTVVRPSVAALTQRVKSRTDGARCARWRVSSRRWMKSTWPLQWFIQLYRPQEGSEAPRPSILGLVNRDRSREARGNLVASVWAARLARVRTYVCFWCHRRTGAIPWSRWRLLQELHQACFILADCTNLELSVELNFAQDSGVLARVFGLRERARERERLQPWRLWMWPGRRSLSWWCTWTKQRHGTKYVVRSNMVPSFWARVNLELRKMLIRPPA